MSEVYTPTRRWCPVDMKTLGCAWTHPAHPIMFSLMVIAQRIKGCFTLDWFWSLYTGLGAIKYGLSARRVAISCLSSSSVSTYLVVNIFRDSHSSVEWTVVRIFHTSYCNKGADFEFAVAERTFWIRSRDFRLSPCSALFSLLLSHQTLTLRLLMSYIYIYIYIYGAPILDVSRSYTTAHHSR